MDDHDGLAFIGEKVSDFRITFLRDVEEQNVLLRFGGNLSRAWPLPFGAYDRLEDLLAELDEDDRLDEEAILQIGTCPGWTFALEWYGPYEPTQRLLEVISSGTMAVSVQRISSKWLRCLDWAEDGVWRGGGEASGPFMPQLQALIAQAGVDIEDEDSDLGGSLFAPILESAFGIRLSRAALEKPLLTGPYVFPIC